MRSPDPDPVAKRRVFYIPGYDPIHPRRYRELYRSEGAAQAQISGYEIGLRPKTTTGAYGWHIDAQLDGHAVQADMDVLVWSDIVRDSMNSSILATYGQLLRTAWVYISTGALFRLMRMRIGPVIAALYPVGMLLLQAVIALLAVRAVMSVTGGVFSIIGLNAGAVPVGLALGAGVAIVILRAFKAYDNKLFVYYLMHDYAYSAASRGANPPELEARMAQFADQIAEALSQDYDEILVVGHSSGAHLGVSILADVIRSDRVPQAGPKLAFLSLGQVVPMVSFLPKAERLRTDLRYLSASDALTWVDVTAPGDGCAFALCDPVAVSGVAPENKRWPLVFSAAYTQSLKPETYAKLKRRYFRLHFQYMCAFDQPKDYDYFQITGGPQTLETRYSNRAASKSRIDHAVSGYRSTLS